MAQKESESSGTVHTTARGVVLHESALLLIERWKSGVHYFSLPGGHIETNEDPIYTVKREILEETTIAVDVVNQIIVFQDFPSRHLFYWCTYKSGQPELPSTSEEYIRSTQTNSWLPLWMPINKISSIPFGYWEPIRNTLLEIIKANGLSSLKVVNTKVAR